MSFLRMITDIVHVTHQRRDSLLFTLILILCLGAYAFPSISSAAIYKCVDNMGNTTYSGSPCADLESTQRISKSAAPLPSMDCRVARKFAADTVNRMQSGESSNALFNSYGGVDSTTPFVRNLVSYVYTFQGNQAVPSSRLTALSTQRCEAGSFGPVGSRCDAFPTEFIASQGGCNLIRGMPGSNDNGTDPANLANTGFQQQAQGATTLGQANPAGSPRQTRTISGAQPDAMADGPTTESNYRIQCRARLTRSIEQIRKQMNELQDASSQDRLTSRARQLRSQLTRC